MRVPTAPPMRKPVRWRRPEIKKAESEEEGRVRGRALGPEYQGVLSGRLQLPAPQGLSWWFGTNMVFGHEEEQQERSLCLECGGGETSGETADGQ